MKTVVDEKSKRLTKEGGLEKINSTLSGGLSPLVKWSGLEKIKSTPFDETSNRKLG